MAERVARYEQGCEVNASDLEDTKKQLARMSPEDRKELRETLQRELPLDDAVRASVIATAAISLLILKGIVTKEEVETVTAASMKRFVEKLIAELFGETVDPTKGTSEGAN